MLFQPLYYSAQAKLPWAASWKRPKIKIIITQKITRNLIRPDIAANPGIAGKTKINSTSKIRKTIEIKKNRIEKGRRAESLGVNPHSNGLAFSRSVKNLEPKVKPKIVSKKANINLKNNLKKNGNAEL